MTTPQQTAPWPASRRRGDVGSDKINLYCRELSKPGAVAEWELDNRTEPITATLESIRELLEVSPAAISLALVLLRRGGMPAKASVDATHIAVAAVNGMDYLLTWNCKHIANAFNLPRVYEACKTEGYLPPFVCTPQELMES